DGHVRLLEIRKDKEIRQNLVLRAQLPEGRIRNRRRRNRATRRAPAVAAVRNPGPCLRSPVDNHKLFRALYREHLEHHRIDQTEDRRGCSNAQRKGEHCHRGKARTAAHHAEPVAKVPSSCRQNSGGACRGTPPCAVRAHPCRSLRRASRLRGSDLVRCIVRSSARRETGTPPQVRPRPAGAEIATAIGAARYRSSVASTYQAFSNATTREMATESRPQLAASFSRCLWPSRVSE